MNLSGKCVVLGVTGGIAAYKAADITSRLKKMGARVRVVMTQSACRFVAPVTFETLSGEKAYADQFERSFEIEHVSLAKSADLFLIAPATANVIGKIACGIADDLLTTSAMAMTCPILIAPAMNNAMWRSAAVQDNVARLTSRGMKTIGPGTGHLACGDEDVGRMSEPSEVALEVARLLLGKRDFEGKRVLVTAGPTREMIDPIRFLSNRSTGKMGYAIAEAARDRGADVVLISGPVSLAPPSGVKLVPITSTQSLYEAMMDLAPNAEAVIQAAAPADFTPAAYSDTKIKKDGHGMALSLVPTPDVAKALGEVKKPGQVLVAFAAETGDLVGNARSKLVKKNCDLVVFNDVTRPGAGFGVDTNQVTLVNAQGETALPLMDKRGVADAILDKVTELLS